MYVQLAINKKQNDVLIKNEQVAIWAAQEIRQIVLFYSGIENHWGGEILGLAENYEPNYVKSRCSWFLCRLVPALQNIDSKIVIESQKHVKH